MYPERWEETNGGGLLKFITDSGEDAVAQITFSIQKYKEAPLESEPIAVETGLLTKSELDKLKGDIDLGKGGVIEINGSSSKIDVGYNIFGKNFFKKVSVFNERDLLEIILVLPRK